MEFIIIFFWGWLAWYLTGTDDFLVFYSIYYNTSSSKNHRLAVLGLITSVLFMILLVIVSNIIVIIVPLVKQYTFVGGIIPIYLGIKTIISSQNNESIDLKKSSYFLLAFLGFFLNSGDDIIFNLSIILGQGLFYQIFFFAGILSGALSMIWIIIQLHTKVKKDFPKFRGVVLILVGTILLLGGFPYK